VNLIAARTRKISSKLLDEMRFLRTWVGKPLTTGAVSPSSRALASLMARMVDIERPGVVVELGPGTGVVTQAILDQGVAPSRLVALEYNKDFCKLLRVRHPAVRVVQGDAYALRDTLRDLIDQPVSAIVSSLPLFSRSPERRVNLLEQALQLLAPGAPFIQFSYAMVPPVPEAAGDWQLERTNWVVLNLPPARVWCYRRAKKPK
jgi:phosphatidylethanolamine/phosphatidyl-N-methylethanolamine N-methyltransferase